MRDRLIELTKRAQNEWLDKEYEHETHKDLAEYVADHLLANGVIVPPVKVGETVYRVYWNYTIDECKVSSLTQKADKSFKVRITSGINRSVFEITPDEIGKTVFLTKEEAEKALAERSENEHRKRD